MNEKNRTVIIPRGMVIVPEDDSVRVRLDWRTELVKYGLKLRQEEERHGTKKENKE